MGLDIGQDLALEILKESCGVETRNCRFLTVPLVGGERDDLQRGPFLRCGMRVKVLHIYHCHLIQCNPIAPVAFYDSVYDIAFTTLPPLKFSVYFS